MNILAIDTSGDTLSLALSSPLGKRQVDISSGPGHSELLIAWIEKLVSSGGMKPEDLELVACMKGPGSFTGLRIGFAAAKGISLALGIPLTALPTLDCAAHSLSIWPGLTLPVMDAKKGRFFAALYRQGKRLSDYLDADPPCLLSALDKQKASPGERIAVTGPSAELFISKVKELGIENGFSLDPLFSKGRAPELLKLIEEFGILNNYEEVDSGPLYLRKSDAEMNLKT